MTATHEIETVEQNNDLHPRLKNAVLASSLSFDFFLRSLVLLEIYL